MASLSSATDRYMLIELIELSDRGDKVICCNNCQNPYKIELNYRDLGHIWM